MSFSNLNNAVPVSFQVQNLSLYIPRVFSNISKERMMHIFDLLDIGWVNSIDFIPKMTSKGQPYNSAYIHFEYWYSNISNENLQNRLNSTLECRIVYDDPWFWIVLKNNGVKKDYSVPRPKINLDGLKEQNEVEVLPVKQSQSHVNNQNVKMFLPRQLKVTKTVIHELLKNKPKSLKFSKVEVEEGEYIPSRKEDHEDYEEAMFEERYIDRENRER
jgi:hypothetical protein